MGDLDERELAVRLARAERELAELDRRRDLLEAEIRAARERLDRAGLNEPAGEGPLAPPPTSPLTPAEKVTLFRSLFRGRVDVFPTRFVSKKTGKAGYAPACANKFVRGVCDLPKVRCGDCPNQAFVPAGEQAVYDHLIGRHVMGVYPLLEDETCWFVAADFDKASWQDDVAAFRETAERTGIPCAVERSRSGNGAHAWFFFASPVSAATARRMGCHLITETMTRRHELRMESYDRLFPNQDTLPRGGFGNLIALPLQHDARQLGNSLFVDGRFEPYADQWSYLRSLPRIDADVVEGVARDAARAGLVVGVRRVDSSDDEDELPWDRTPSGRPSRVEIGGSLPATVAVVSAQRIYVDKRGLPSALLNQIKRLAAFQNPEFYKKQKMRFSTALTPRVIACAEEFDQHVALPRGCLGELQELLARYEVEVALEDKREDGEPIGLSFNGDLTDLQHRAARAVLEHDIGVVVAPPGVGKTVLGTFLVAERGRGTLVLVHRRPLLDQWIAQLSMFLGIKSSEIGSIGGGKSKPNGRLDVAMIQSLVRRDEVSDLVASYGHVIVDECHHVPAISFERVLSEIRARYVLGLTATPHRRDGHQPILEMQLGPVRLEVSAKSQAAARPFEHRLIVRETEFRLPPELDGAGIQEQYRAVVRDGARNEMIVEDVREALCEGRSPLVLT